MPIATVEHHLLVEPTLSTYDLAERLVGVWDEIRLQAGAGEMNFQPDCILSLNAKIARAFNAVPGVFNGEDDWAEFVDACNFQEGPEQALSWIFSALYWQRLTRFKLATAWLYMNAIRAQHAMPTLHLTLNRLGPFLESLSGSGPPLYDGQTFYPENYAHLVGLDG